MMRVLNKFPRLWVLGIALALVACTITTEKAYFTDSDFVRPKVLSGDWVSVPTEPGDDVIKMRIDTHGKLWRAQPLTKTGEIDAKEEPVDFGLVQLGSSEFIVVQRDSPTSPVNYLGLKAQEDKLDFYLFAGGESAAGEERFNALLADLKIARNANMTHEARLTGDLDTAKLKNLFGKLLEAPEKYDAHPTVYKRINP